MTLIIDHVEIFVADLDRAKRFYAQALEPLGIGLVMEVTPDGAGAPVAAGFGRGGKPSFWIALGEPHRTHVAFVADDRVGVDAFYKAALAAGGTDNGAPGLRPEYHPAYYGAFVLDPDGYNMEAVCHKPE